MGFVSTKLNALPACTVCLHCRDIDVEKGGDYVDCSNMMFISDQKNDEPKFTTRYERTVGLTIPCIGFGEK